MSRNATPPGDFIDPAEATVQPMTEEALAEQQAALGKKIRKAGGRHWVETRRGFYEPIHPLARLTKHEARRPGMCWGYRAALHEDHAASSNASVPVHLLPDLADFEWMDLPNDSRRYLRKFPSQGIRLIRVRDLELLVDQGYQVMLEWRARLGIASPPTPRDLYRRQIAQRIGGEGWLTLAGLDGDRLLGYMSVWAVGQTAYLQDSKVATEARPARLGQALDYEALKALQRVRAIREVSAGFHTPELPQLTEYKLRQGFGVVQVPAIARLPKPVAVLLRSRRPGTYYRLTGRRPESVPAQGT